MTLIIWFTLKNQIFVDSNTELANCADFPGFPTASAIYILQSILPKLLVQIVGLGMDEE